MAKIITHSGQAHRDEFVACCLLLATSMIDEILRIPHSKFTFDMQEPGDFVVDIGLEDNSRFRRYDHHQDKPVFGESRSAFARVAEDILGWDAAQASKVFPWYQLSSDMDCHGPSAVAASLGLPVTELMKTMSPIEAQLLLSFERDPNSLIPLMREMGSSWIKYYAEYTAAEQLHLAAQQITRIPYVVDFTDLDQAIVVLDLSSLDVSQQHNAVSGRLAQDLGAAVIVSRDPTGAGLSLFRVDDHPDVDFNYLAGQPEILFTHASGFIAKTTTVDVDWQMLIQIVLLAKILEGTTTAEEVAKARNMSNSELAS